MFEETQHSPPLADSPRFRAMAKQCRWRNKEAGFPDTGSCPCVSNTACPCPPRPLRILVCGSRKWDNSKSIRDALARFPAGTVLIHGDCRGADKMADTIGKQLGFDVVPFPADWDAYDNAAGPIRNQQMLDEGKPDLVLAFSRWLLQSKGTKDMVSRAQAAGVECRVFRS